MAHHTQSGTTFSRAFTRQTSQRKAYVGTDLEHAHELSALKVKIAKTALQLPPALVINNDLDATLYRFLRARSYNVDRAYAMLEKCLQWRQRVGADTVLEQPYDTRLAALIRSCRTSSYIGYDHKHHPIFVERIGKLDGRRMEREGVADEDLLAYHLREMEFMGQVVLAEASAAAGHTVDRTVTMMDAHGLSLAQLTGFSQRIFRLLAGMDSDNYPECCDAIYVVNAGTTFTAIWRLLSPFVDKGTRDKIRVTSGGKHSQQVLFDAFGAELVPNFLHGQLDYEAVRQQWLNKMDAAIGERQKHPKGPQPPIVLQVDANGQHPQQQQQQQVQSARSSFTGASHWQHRPSIAAGERTSSDADGWATPMSVASRMSSVSTVGTVYFDAAEEPSSPVGSPSSTFSGVAQAPFYQTHGDPAGSTAGSMSVEPQSRTRSQGSMQSGFTNATVGQGLQGHSVAGAGGGRHGGSQTAFNETTEGQQRLCGCRCVIC